MQSLKTSYTLAIKELFRGGAFGKWPCSRAAGEKDFLWLMALLVASMLLAWFALAMDHGIRGTLLEATVGAVSGRGSPIYLRSQSEGFTAEPLAWLQKQLKAEGDLLPHLEEYKQFQIPGTVSEPEGRKLPLQGKVWAVQREHPFWVHFDKTRYPTANVVLNRIVMSDPKHFSCESYSAALDMAEIDYESIHIKNPPLGLPECLSSGLIWLKVHRNKFQLKATVTNTGFFVPFRILDYRKVTTPDKVALFIPLDVVYALHVSKHTDEKYILTYFDLSQPEAPTFYKKIRLLDFNNEIPTKQRVSFNNCLGEMKGKIIEHGDWLMEFPLPILKQRILDCAQDNNIPLIANGKGLEVSTQVISNIRVAEKEQLILSCENLEKLKKPRRNATIPPACTENHNKRVPADLYSLKLVNNYTTAILFVKQPEKLQEVAMRIPNFVRASSSEGGCCNELANASDSEAPLLFVHETYFDSLVRLAFIGDVLDLLKIPFAFIFSILLILILFSLVGFVLSHRKNLYGNLLSMGVTFRQIRNIVLIQLTFCSLGSFVVASGVFYILGWYVQEELNILVNSKDSLYINKINITNDALIQFNFMEQGTVAIIIWLFVCLIAVVKLDLLAIKKASQPANLLFG